MTKNINFNEFSVVRAEEWQEIQKYISAVLRRDEVAVRDCQLFKMAYQGADIDALQKAVDAVQVFADKVELDIVEAETALEKMSPLALNRAVLIGNLNHGGRYFKVSVKSPKNAVEKMRSIIEKHISSLTAVGDGRKDMAQIGKLDVMAFREALNVCAKSHDEKSGLNRSQAEALFFGMVEVKSRWNNPEERDYKIADVHIKGRSAIDTAVRTLVASKLQASYIANMETLEGQQWLLAQQETK